MTNATKVRLCARKQAAAFKDSLSQRQAAFQRHAKAGLDIIPLAWCQDKRYVVLNVC